MSARTKMTLGALGEAFCFLAAILIAYHIGYRQMAEGEKINTKFEDTGKIE